MKWGFVYNVENKVYKVFNINKPMSFIKNNCQMHDLKFHYASYALVNKQLNQNVFYFINKFMGIWK